MRCKCSPWHLAIAIGLLELSLRLYFLGQT